MTRTVAGHTITVPTVSSPRTRSTGTNTGSSGTGIGSNLSPTITLPDGTTVKRSALAPFRDCLVRHGVTGPPQQLPQRSGKGFNGVNPQQASQIRTRARAWVECAPQLPPPLRRAFERYRHRLQQRRQGG